MDRLDPIDAMMMTAEVVSSPMHVGVLLTMTPPPGEDAGYDAGNIAPPYGIPPEDAGGPIPLYGGAPED